MNQFSENRGIQVRAQYDADVMQQIGKEANKFILNRVKCGVISTQFLGKIITFWCQSIIFIVHFHVAYNAMQLLTRLDQYV